MLPEGWKHIKFGQAFETSREKGNPSLPTLSVTLTDGLVARDSLDRKMETNLEPDEHLLVRRDDIAYNMMRMWQGASGLATHDAVVSPAYVVLRARKNIDPLFASYLFKLPRTIHNFWAYSYGITDDRLRLYFKDFGAISVNLPPIAEQRKIAEILSTWDRAIAVQERFVANAQAQKKSLMQNLLTGKKRLRGFKEEWKVTTLGKIGAFRKGKGIQREDLRPTGFPAIRYGEIYTHHHEQIRQFHSFVDAAGAARGQPISSGDIVFTCSGETAEEIGKCVAYLGAETAYAGGDTIILSAQANNAAFLSYLLNCADAVEQKRRLGQGNSIVHIGASDLAKLRIGLPKLLEQDSIASIINVETERIIRLEADLVCLVREKSALMQQLLTGKRRLKVAEISP